jgi:hypothetical protein
VKTKIYYANSSNTNSVRLGYEMSGYRIHNPKQHLENELADAIRARDDAQRFVESLKRELHALRLAERGSR